MSLASKSDVGAPAPGEALSGLLLVDKARGMSSHDVVARARRALGTRRIGHTGTLDPMATGLLVLAVGEGTKLVAYLTEHDKRYDCTIRLGVETDSLDADGKVTSQAPVPPLTQTTVEAVCRGLEAQTTQVPPMVSAIQIDGERLYKRARRGEQVDVPARAVTLHSIVLRAIDGDDVDLTVHCGKGFYIRALARDLANALGTVAHLTQLRRTHVGTDDVAFAVASSVLEAASRGDALARDQVRSRVIPLNVACARLPSVTLNAAGTDHASHGRAVPLDCVEGTLPAVEQPVMLFDSERQPVAIGQVTAESITIARGFVRPNQRGSTSA